MKKKPEVKTKDVAETQNKLLFVLNEKFERESNKSRVLFAVMAKKNSSLVAKHLNKHF